MQIIAEQGYQKSDKAEQKGSTEICRTSSTHIEKVKTKPEIVKEAEKKMKSGKADPTQKSSEGKEPSSAADARIINTLKIPCITSVYSRNFGHNRRRGTSV